MKEPPKGVIAALASVIVLIAVTVATTFTGVSLKFWARPQSAWTPPAAPAAAPLPPAAVREQPAKFLADVHQRIDSDGEEIRGLSDQQLLAIGRASCRQPGIVQARTQLRSLQRPKFLAAARVYLCGQRIPAAKPAPSARSGEPSGTPSAAATPSPTAPETALFATPPRPRVNPFTTEQPTMPPSAQSRP